jgi:uncharacterized protein (DUF1697 family)
MTAVVSMLRGVNVGPHKRIRMDALQALYESLKLGEPRTYIQSGNVVFKTGERSLERVSKRIEDGIERTFGFRCDVILRGAAEMRDVVARNPFAGRGEIENSRLLVTFLAGDPGREARAAVEAIHAGPEEIRASGRELYIYFPDGVGRSKLTPALIEKTMKAPGTARNWNSVVKLLEMAEELEG